MAVKEMPANDLYGLPRWCKGVRSDEQRGVDCVPISGLLLRMVALALMVMRALGRHPRNGLAVDLGRYRVPRVAVCPVCHHVVFLAASGELVTLAFVVCTVLSI